MSVIPTLFHTAFPYLLVVALLFVSFLYLTGVRVHEARDARYRRIVKTEDSTALPYSSRQFLCTRTEQRFYETLRRAVEPGLKVCPKTRLADIVHCSDTEWRNGYGSPISSKHLDFTLVNPHSLRIACCIELDDSSHQRDDRRARDRFVNAAMKSAGVPLLRYKVANSYDPRAIQRRVYAVLRSETQEAA